MEEGKVLFRTKNDWNVIVEEDDCYVLCSRQGQAVFDKDKSALCAVINAIQKYGNAKWSKANRSGYRFQDNHRNFICSLAQVLYCAYTGMPIDKLSGRKLRYVDGNPFNLQKDNIVMPNKQSVQCVSILGKQYIRLQVYTKDQKCHSVITNSDDGLFELLSSLPWTYHRGNACLTTKVQNKRYYLHHIIYVYFNSSDVSKSNLYEKITAFQANRHVGRLVIDHKKSFITGERWDNRVENLQLIPQALNSSKKDSTSKLHGDLFYIPTANGEIYGHYDWTNGYIDFCENEGDATVASIDQLRQFCKTGEFQETDNHYKIPLDSPKGVEIQQADFRETKLYSEVLIYD